MASATIDPTDPLLAALRQYFGHDAFRPQQREVIEHVQSHGDALVLMPTGGGKSLCYQLPAILSDGLTLVVSPLIALMHDQVQALQRAGANARSINSAMSPHELSDVERDVVSGAVRLLYVAPERVNTERFRRLLERQPPSLIAIDEAHCISEWGHEFRPDYRELRKLTERFVDVPTVACTATATPQVQRDIVQQLDRPRMQTFSTGFMRDNLTLRILPKRKAIDVLAERLLRVRNGAAIVYSLSRRSTERHAEQLRDRGISAAHYHAGMNGAERHSVQDRFLAGETAVVCATIAFGMGIDKPDVRLVAHLDMPSSIESYYQEIGRAGRDGEPSECLLFYTKGVWHRQKHFIDQLTDETERQARIQRLRTMMNFCEQSSCRWARILNYFGDSPTWGTCSHCDNCNGEQGLIPQDIAAVVVNPDDPPQPPGQSTPPDSDGIDNELYEALRDARFKLAQRDDVPAFVVASNRELSDIATVRPGTPQELREIKGFRDRKIARYGAELLSVVAQFSDVSQDRAAAEESQPMPVASRKDTDEPSGDAPLSWQQRFNALAEWRTLTSNQESCDPSDLLTFEAMRALAQSVPPTVDALARVDGVGSLAVERYWRELSAILEISEAPVAQPVEKQAEPSPSTPAGDTQQSWETTLNLFQSGHSLLAIAERRMLSPATVASHLVTAMRNGVSVDLEPALPPQPHIARVRRLLDVEPEITVGDLHERIGLRLSRAELRLVIAWLTGSPNSTHD